MPLIIAVFSKQLFQWPGATSHWCSLEIAHHYRGPQCIKLRQMFGKTDKSHLPGTGIGLFTRLWLSVDEISALEKLKVTVNWFAFDHFDFNTRHLSRRQNDIRLSSKSELTTYIWRFDRYSSFRRSEEEESKMHITAFRWFTSSPRRQPCTRSRVWLDTSRYFVTFGAFN